MEFDEEEEKAFRELELKYDKLYKEVYEQRRKILLGEVAPSDDFLQEYEQRAKELEDEDYKKLEITPADVKDIQNCPLGVPGFWLKAMLNQPSIARLVQEKDRPILMHLQDVQYNLHTEGYGFDLTFTFEKNDYFNDLVLKKSFVMAKQNIIEKCVGTEISWKDGKDVTKKKVKKKSKSKNAAQKTITKTVECESFFNFFKTLEMPDEKELKEGEKPQAEEEEEKDIGEKMDEDFEVGNEFKDQLIPLALEYYLEVIEEDEEDEGCDSCEDDHHDKDSEEEDKPKGKKKKGGKGPEG